MLLRFVPGQQLEEDDVSAATKTRWPIFPKWGWTPDTTSKLEAQDIKIDRWPWEDTVGVDGWSKADYAPLG